jgi:CII-binding regulator of phage lambda lysogenization HflD
MDETIQNLQDNMNKMNLNLLTTVKRLEDKEKLMQNLQSEVGKLRRQLESEVIERF